MHRRIATVFLVAAALRAAAQSPACHAVEQAQHRLALADGSTISIDESGVAVRGDTIALVGTKVYVFRPDGMFVPHDSALGVIGAVSGPMRLIPSPLPARSLETPRITRDSRGGWRVVFTTGSHAWPANANALDSATVWTGRFDGRQWHDVAKIAHVTRARIDARYSSPLVGWRDEYAFAFAVERDTIPNAAPYDALILLHGSGSGWRQDTLRTSEAPSGVALAVDSMTGTLVAAYSGAYFVNHRFWPQSLFIARFDGRWRDPVMAVGDTSRGPTTEKVNTPMIAIAGGRAVVGWESYRTMNDNAMELRGVRLAPDDHVSTQWSVANGDMFTVPAMLALPAGDALWLTRDGDRRDSLSVLREHDGVVRETGPVAGPFYNFAVHAIVLSASSVLAVTGEIVTTPAGMSAATNFTTIRFDCR